MKTIRGKGFLFVLYPARASKLHIGRLDMLENAVGHHMDQHSKDMAHIHARLDELLTVSRAGNLHHKPKNFVHSQQNSERSRGSRWRGAASREENEQVSNVRAKVNIEVDESREAGARGDSVFVRSLPTSPLSTSSSRQASGSFLKLLAEVNATPGGKQLAVAELTGREHALDSSMKFLHSNQGAEVALVSDHFVRKHMDMVAGASPMLDPRCAHLDDLTSTTRAMFPSSQSSSLRSVVSSFLRPDSLQDPKQKDLEQSRGA